jgi:four helix bundle protein
MGRLKTELLEWVEAFSHKVLDVAAILDEHGVSRRIVDQIAASGTSAGANLYEADEDMSRKNFIKCLSIAAKVLSETRYWLRIALAREWVSNERGRSVLVEGYELQKIVGTMIVRTKKQAPIAQRPTDFTCQRILYRFSLCTESL